MLDPFFPPSRAHHLLQTSQGVGRAAEDCIKEINIDYVIPLHCTGEPFYDKARAEMPGKVLRSYTGTRFVFS